MSNTMNSHLIAWLTAACLWAGVAPGAHAKTQAEPAQRDVDLVIALDVSDSMSGLIASAKQRLWDVVNELGRAQPAPALRVAILTYGNPSYGAQSGYVRLDLPFTSDLDAVNEKLFSFQTSGGDEYVARVVHSSLQSLQWSTRPDALRVLFVAGNESAEQDPQFRNAEVMRLAAQKHVVVNAIYCGHEQDAVAAEWQRFAAQAHGMYASIDQHAAAVAGIATPMDAELAALNAELNTTYLAIGAAGKRAQEKQLAQDANAAGMSAPALASRVVTKAGALYRSDWDLLDSLESGAKLEEIAPEDLPEEMRDMDAAGRAVYVEQKAQKRRALQEEIAKLDTARRAYVDEQRRAEQLDADKGLDTAMLEGLRRVAAAQGFEF